MGYVLLWVENLGVLLLTVAVVTACVGRLRRRWLRHGLLAITSIAIFLPLLVLTLFWWSAVYQHQTWAVKWFDAMLALTISFAVGSLWLWIRGLRRIDNAPMPTAAGDWPRGKLAMFLAIAVALHLMTIWNLDLAARQQLETLRVEAGQLGQSVAPLPVADRDNAAILYEQASEAMGPEGNWPKAFTEWANRWKIQGGGLDEPLNSQLRQVLHDWRGALALLHEAASKPGYYVDRQYHRPTLEIQLSDLQNMRYMASVLALDGQDKAATGDLRGALQDINTRLAMARHVASEPLAMALMVSAGLEGNALNTLQGLLKRKKVSAADLATLRIENGSSYRKLLERALRMEEAVLLMTIYEVDTGQGQLSRVLFYACPSVDQEPPTDHPILDSVLTSVHRVFLLPGELDVSQRLLREMCEAVRKPYGKAKPLWEECETQARFHGGILLNLLNPATARWDEGARRADATRQAARLAVAAFLYREKNGHFPENLNDLTPEFIFSLPTDPFDGKPMKLKRTDHGIVVYSVGPDMVDNGGAPFDSIKQTGDITFKVSSPPNPPSSISEP
jgi:hypothetical protein